MWMLIFGAGASYDSVPVDRWLNRVSIDLQPPLTVQLFDQRPKHRDAWANWPSCAPLVMELWYVAHAAIDGGPSVEEHLQSIVERHGETDRVRRQLMALRFYVRDVIQRGVGDWMNENGPANNYAALLEQMARLRPPDERLLLVTFNYDLMLDQARNVVFDSPTGLLDDYIAGHAPLIRPHGSVGWSRLARYQSVPSHQLIEAAGTYELSDQIVPVGSQNDMSEVPAIAIPTRGKVAFECPPEHIETLEQMLPEVTRVISIGWQGQEEEFLKRCKQHLSAEVRGLVVSGERAHAKRVALHLHAELGGSWSSSPLEGFSAFVAAGRAPIEEFE
jgi:hypothetical protein